MSSDEKNAQTPANSNPEGSGSDRTENPAATTEATTATDTSVETGYGPYDDPYASGAEYSEPVAAAVPATSSPAEPPPPAPPKTTDEDEGGEEEDGMLRMSFLEHLEELRTRIIRALIGLVVAFLVSLTFSERLWGIVQEPASDALKSLGYKDAYLIFTSPMESFSIIWMKLPLLTSLFIASPWILYQVWAFIAPGLYKRERRLAGPFILSSAGLFILGGLFAYFIAFRFGLTFLLGIGQAVGVRPMVTISEYFDIFVNVILGIGIVFELPVLIFFLTLLRIASPRFLISHSRYAVLGIVILAAIITPTPDVFNLMIFSVPMVLLYFIGVFASYLLVLNRENRRFPWGKLFLAMSVVLLLAAVAVWIAVTRFGFEIVSTWPYLLKK